METGLLEQEVSRCVRWRKAFGGDMSLFTEAIRGGQLLGDTTQTCGRWPLLAQPTIEHHSTETPKYLCSLIGASR